MDEPTRLELPGLRESEVAEEKPAAGRKRGWLKALTILASSLLVLSLMVGGGLWWAANSALSSITRDPGLLPSAEPATTATSVAAPQEEAEPLNFLVLGSDSRGSDQGRSDVLMLAHLSSDRSEMYLVSFPRDLYVAIPGHGKNKINAAYAFGGAALTAETIKELVGVDVDHAALIDFEGFISLSEVVGGVSVWNKTQSTNLGFTFPRGQITLSGEELLAYVRQRHGLANGDLDRAERQRMVLKAMIKKLASKETLTDPARVLAVANRVGGYLTVDSGLTNDRILAIAAELRLEGGGDVVTLQAPISGFGRSPAGASIDLVDTRRMAELATALQDDTMADYVEASDAADTER